MREKSNPGEEKNQSLDTGPGGSIFVQAIHPATAEHTFFANARGTFTKKDHILGREKISKMQKD